MHRGMATLPVGQSRYTPELAASVIKRISHGENLRAIMRAEQMGWSTFYDWLRADPQLQADYEEARILGAHAIAHDALALLEQQPERVDKRVDPGFVQWQRLKLEGTLKILAKWFPQHYGDKLLHAGHDGGAIKSETALSVKELAQQLRARASGLTIEGDAIDADNAPRALQYAGSAEVTATGTERSGDGLEAVSTGEADGKRRSRGVGDRGGALKRGASGETGGTPPTDIFSENSTEQSTTCFPSDANWSPEDYV